MLFHVGDEYYCVGLDVNGNHIKSVKQGKVYAKASPLHIGRSTQVWCINVTDDSKKLICTSRLTVAVLKRDLEN